MIRQTGLAPWESEFPFPGSRASTFLVFKNLLIALLTNPAYRFPWKPRLPPVEKSHLSEASQVIAVHPALTHLGFFSGCFSFASGLFVSLVELIPPRAWLGSPLHYRDTSLIRKRPPPEDHHRALVIGLLQGPRGRRLQENDAPPATYSGLMPRALQWS